MSGRSVWAFTMASLSAHIYIAMTKISSSSKDILRGIQSTRRSSQQRVMNETILYLLFTFHSKREK